MALPDIELGDPVFEAFGACFSVQVATLANVYAVDLAQTSAREETPAFVVRAAALRCAGSRVPGAVVLRIEPDPAGGLSVRLRAKAPEPIRSTTLLLRGLATPLEIVASGAPEATFVLRCGDEQLSVRVDARRAGDTSARVMLERSGERAGQGVVALTHAPVAGSAVREYAAPVCVILRGG